MQTLRPLSLVLLALCASLATSQEPTGPRDLGPVLEEVLADSDVPGIGAAIVTSEGLVARGVAGVRERGSDAKIRPGDRFHIGSCTKAMTATLLARSVEAQKLRWDITLAEAFPDLEGTMEETWRDVTLTQLLSHTAGMTSDIRSYEGLGLVYRMRTEPMLEVRRKFVEGLLKKPPLTEPGTKYAYANYGYVTAGAILERLEGKPWEELVRAQLFEPLGMTATGFGGPDAPDFAETASEDEGASQPRGHFENGEVARAFDNVPLLGPAGRVHCTLDDWAKFVRVHLRGARGEQGLLLQPSTFAVLHAAGPGTKHLRNWRAASYGKGWVVTTRPWSKGEVLTHDGSNTAWFAVVWIAPEEDFAVLVSCNRGGKFGRKAAGAAADRLIADMVKRRASEGTGDD